MPLCPLCVFSIITVPRHGQKIAFSDVNIEENVLFPQQQQKLHVLLEKGTFYLEKGHFSLIGKRAILGVENGGGGGRRPCPQQPWTPWTTKNLICMTRVFWTFLFLRRLLANRPIGSPQLCRRSRSFLPQAERIHLYLESVKSVSFPTSLIVWNSYKALIILNKILITRWRGRYKSYIGHRNSY